jgi:hypothetical protein
MAQYFAHALECWHYSDPVAVGERSAFQVVVESNQVTAKPLDKCVDGEMNFRVPILSGCLGLRHEVCQSRPINCEGPRRGCRLNGSGRFARGHKALLADRFCAARSCQSTSVEQFRLAVCRVQSPSVGLAIVPVTTPTFPGVAKDCRDLFFILGNRCYGHCRTVSVRCRTLDTANE